MFNKLTAIQYERMMDELKAENKKLKAFILLFGIIKVDTTRHRYWKDKYCPICMHCHQGLFFKDDYTDDGYLLDEDCGCILKHDPDNYHPPAIVPTDNSGRPIIEPDLGKRCFRDDD
tara:strand:+ start:366 stop:716 length:351 start_codon:yes stop_codon:yes gene_type:complete